MEMHMTFIDFDGVILDTETNLFRKYNALKDRGVNITREQYLAEMNWYDWLEQANIINDSLEILRNNSSSIATILTTIHSFNEGKMKVDYLRRNGVKNDVVLVPYVCKKHEVVEPNGRVLVDDYGGNLKGWQTNGGIPIRFSTNVFKTYDDFNVVSNLQDVFDKFIV